MNNTEAREAYASGVLELEAARKKLHDTIAREAEISHAIWVIEANLRSAREAKKKSLDDFARGRADEAAVAKARQDVEDVNKVYTDKRELFLAVSGTKAGTEQSIAACESKLQGLWHAFSYSERGKLIEEVQRSIQDKVLDIYAWSALMGAVDPVSLNGLLFKMPNSSDLQRRQKELREKYQGGAR